MPGEQYPQDTYNSMVKDSIAAGFVKPTGCPEGMF
jgi:hypothetical protein